ncbi:hypothetical protein FNV43_RR11400 [Rhamnella rubrinervis]|uniref:DUF868 domain-containing protein n=1 Tax=Rhamnella rubrinervis TaxID=2594499 RepID=A0A8K0H5H2_9ROSA|nr:hypothetical protein FNV43_RR11400 [Rhamnella rubrinervis]
MSTHTSPFPSCFRPSATTEKRGHAPPPPPPPPPPISGNPNLTTFLYHTDLALFSLTWSRSFVGRSLRLHLLHRGFESPPPPLFSSPTFHLHIKPFIFWKKHGSKKLAPNVYIFWELSKAKFGTGPDPQSGFYIAVVVDKVMTLLVGDLTKEAYAKTKAHKSPSPHQVLILKREHVVADKLYTTRAKFGGKMREIQIDCGYNDGSRLCFSVDNKKVLQVKRLKWKFRGNERIEVDGVPVHISWDVYNWLFETDHHNDDGHAVFMFKFEEDEDDIQMGHYGDKNGMDLSWNMGMNGIEWRKMGKSLSSSSVSMSSGGSSRGGSSVMEWASMEESELSGGRTGFSLLVYAWRR